MYVMSVTHAESERSTAKWRCSRFGAQLGNDGHELARGGEIADRTVTYAEDIAMQAAGGNTGPRCATEADFAGRFLHESMQCQGYSRETASVSAGVWPEPWGFEIVPGDFDHAFTILNAENGQVKAMCIAQAWKPDTLECMDVDDLGVFTFKATKSAPNDP